MGSGASISTKSVSPIKSRKIEVVEKRPILKKLDSFDLDLKIVKKQRNSMESLIFRPNGTSIYWIEPAAPPTSPTAYYDNDGFFDYYDATSGCKTSTSVSSSQGWRSPSPFYCPSNSFDFSPQTIIQSPSSLRHMNNNASYAPDECRQNFDCALKHIENRRRGRSSHANSFASADEYTDHFKRTVKNYASP